MSKGCEMRRSRSSFVAVAVLMNVALVPVALGAETVVAKILDEGDLGMDLQAKTLGAFVCSGRGEILPEANGKNPKPIECRADDTTLLAGAFYTFATQLFLVGEPVVDMLERADRAAATGTVCAEERIGAGVGTRVTYQGREDQVLLVRFFRDDQSGPPVNVGRELFEAIVENDEGMRFV